MCVLYRKNPFVCKGNVILPSFTRKRARKTLFFHSFAIFRVSSSYIQVEDLKNDGKYRDEYDKGTEGRQSQGSADDG